jgi:hypothetical protein
VQWSWVRILDFLGANGGVVHGRGFESLTFCNETRCAYRYTRALVGFTFFFQGNQSPTDTIKLPVIFEVCTSSSNVKFVV